MKKVLFFALIIMNCKFSFSQYLLKDFDDLSLNSGGWTTQIIIDTTNWFVDSFGGDDFVKATNYSNGSNIPADTWLISPAVDLSTSNQPILNFETIMKWAGDALVLYVSTDYDGFSNPNQQGTWADITTMATWDVDNTTWGNWTPSGDVDLSVYKSTNTYIAFEYIGTSSSGSTWEIDNIAIVEGSSPVQTISLYDIQQTSDPNGISPYYGQQVNTGGIVSAVNSDSTFFLSSGSGPWSGIYVYNTNYLVSVGDSIILQAEVEEFYNLTELKNISSLQVISSNNNPIVNYCTTEVVNYEEFEGCLIAVSGVCVNDNSGFGEWIVNDGSGDLSIDDLLYSYSPVLNYSYNITGVSTYSYGAVKLLPRNLSDISIPFSIENGTSSSLICSPNPLCGDYLNVSVGINSKLLIIDINGKVVSNHDLKIGENLLQLDNLNSGMYFLKFNNNITKIIVNH